MCRGEKRNPTLLGEVLCLKSQKCHSCTQGKTSVPVRVALAEWGWLKQKVYYLGPNAKAETTFPKFPKCVELETRNLVQRRAERSHRPNNCQQVPGKRVLAGGVVGEATHSPAHTILPREGVCTRLGHLTFGKGLELSIWQKWERVRVESPLKESKEHIRVQASQVARGRLYYSGDGQGDRIATPAGPQPDLSSHQSHWVQ